MTVFFNKWKDSSPIYNQLESSCRTVGIILQKIIFFRPMTQENSVYPLNIHKLSGIKLIHKVLHRTTTESTSDTWQIYNTTEKPKLTKTYSGVITNQLRRERHYRLTTAVLMSRHFSIAKREFGISSLPTPKASTRAPPCSFLLALTHYEKNLQAALYQSRTILYQIRISWHCVVKIVKMLPLTMT
ncbi:MAG: hypothetical protein PHP85_09865 [Gallionella sp.]|nr:hypothetical protein [Gallionella sp.]